MTRTLVVVTLGALAFVAVSGTAEAQNKCAGEKIKAAGKKAVCKAVLEANQAAAGGTIDPAKVAKCEAKLSATYAKQELGSCLTTGDAAAIEGKVDAFVADLDTELSVGTLPNKCQGAKIKTAAKKALCKAALEAKQAATGGTIDPAKVAKCEAKLSATFAKQELGGACNSTGDAAAIEAKVDAFVADVDDDINVCPQIVVGQPIPNTYRLLSIAGSKRCHTNATANKFGACSGDGDCGGNTGTCVATPWVTADGITLPFPTGINTTFTIAAAAGAPLCNHAACINCGNASAVCTAVNGGCTGNSGCIGGGGAGTPGRTCCDAPNFTAPAFAIPAISACSRINQKACGIGEVNTSNPQTGDNEVIKEGDTSDPGADCIEGNGDDPAAKPCDTGGSGEGNDTKGKITRVIGDGNDDANGIQIRVQTPQLSTTWLLDNNGCPSTATYDAGETLLSQILLQAEPSTAGAKGTYVDMDGDSCSFAGAGYSGPTADASLAAAPQPYNGSSGSVSVAVGFALSGSSPLFDIGFVAVTPNAVTTIIASQACSCSPVLGCPE